MLVEYVRNKKNRKCGVVVAIDSRSIGWSAVREKEHCTKGSSYISPRDYFDKDRALEIAMGRAILSQTRPSKVVPPKHVQAIIDKMAERARRYFKNGQDINKWEYFYKEVAR